MKLGHCLSIALLPLVGLATPTPGQAWDDHTCLSDADAAFLVDIMVSLSVKFDPEYVTQFMTDDFYLQSDGINWLIDLPAGATTFADKASLLAGAYALTESSPQPPITITYIFHSCTDIAYRANTEEEPPVQGIHILKTRYEGGQWKVAVSFDEINTAADLYALGVTACKLPPPTA